MSVSVWWMTLDSIQLLVVTIRIQLLVKITALKAPDKSFELMDDAIESAIHDCD